MKRTTFLLAVALLIVLPRIAGATADRIIVRYVASTASPAAHLASDLRALGFPEYAPSAQPLLRFAAAPTNPFRATATIDVPHGESGRVLEKLNGLTNILYAERDATGIASFTPNDPQFSAQWHWQKIGAEAAWDYDTNAPLNGGDPSVKIAVLDTGAAYETYNDNGTEYAQSPDFGLTTFSNPYDFVNDDTHADDDNGHGTHVTGTIAESTNNNIGGAGLAFNSTIIPVKVLNRLGVGSMSDVAEAITYAVEKGAQIINLSLGTNTPTLTLQTAVTAALAQSVIIVAATGNDGASTLSYPAAYDGVIAVSAIGEDDLLASYSNYGLGVTITAPGGDDESYIWQMGYSNLDGNNLPADFVSFALVGYQGTSQATPQVSGAAALLLARGAPASGIKSILENTTTDLGTGTGYDTQNGWGRLNIAAALAAFTVDTTPPVSSISVSPASPDGNGGYYKTKPAISLSATDVGGSGVSEILYQWNGGVSITYAAPLSPPEGINTLSFSARDVTGNLEIAQTASFTVDSEGPVITVTRPASFFQSSATVVVQGTVSDALSGFASLTVEGNPVTVDALGAFATTVTHVFHTRPTLTIEATDVAGATRSFTKPLNLGTRERIIVANGAGKKPFVRIFANSGRALLSFLGLSRTFLGGLNIAHGDIDGDNTDELVVASASVGGPRVRLFTATGRLIGQFFAYSGSFHGGVRLAVGNFDGSGSLSIVTAPGPGLRPELRLFTMKGEQAGKFDAFSASLKSGVYVAAGDVRGDGRDEIIATPDSGGSPDLRIFSGSGTLLKRFYAFEKSYRGGVETATCDLVGGGRSEILAVPSGERAPLLRVFSGGGSLSRQFRPFPSTSTAGLTVACGDINADGRNEILVAEKKDGGNLRVFTSAGKLLYRYTELPTGTNGFSLTTAFTD